MSEPLRTRVLNFWSGPGAGKSTTKAGTFFLLKALGEKAAQIEEYATERSVEEDWETLANQRKVTKKQEKRQARFVGKVNWLVTDSPLVLGCIYGRGEYATPEFYKEVWSLFDRYENINVWIDRVKPYQRYARHHDEDEARLLDIKLRSLCNHIVDFTVAGDEQAPEKVVQYLRDRYKF